ncbi:hypothetical protein A5681_20275 [Mycobacterium scrofulaceum]|uniref:DUF6636 domain-containing protein n=1 Tax=Mycobacterium scrofulaceum TaxID=1783 RepID=UPI0008008F85|nr:DUF6636 domain-containing protein [Mycobacterium scrofulaceum]OBH84027.1 hypothetical protein A5681_20275 [Mycobacterium scrofulaceum]
MKAKTAAALAAVTAVAPGIAHADPFYQFQSPSGDVTCVMAAFQGDAPRASCGVAYPTYVMPLRPQSCMGAFGDQVDIVQGSSPAMVCHTDTTRGTGLPTLQAGDTRSVAALTCKSEAAAVTCTDTGTGHFFRLSREAYNLK